MLSRLDIHYQASLINSPDLVKSLDPSGSFRSEERLVRISRSTLIIYRSLISNTIQESTLKKINKNEKDIQKFSASHRQLEEKLQSQIENLNKERELREQDRKKTREILE